MHAVSSPLPSEYGLCVLCFTGQSGCSKEKCWQDVGRFSRATGSGGHHRRWVKRGPDVWNTGFLFLRHGLTVQITRARNFAILAVQNSIISPILTLDQQIVDEGADILNRHQEALTYLPIVPAVSSSATSEKLLPVALASARHRLPRFFESCVDHPTTRIQPRANSQCGTPARPARRRPKHYSWPPSWRSIPRRTTRSN